MQPRAGSTMGAGRIKRPATVRVWDPFVRIFHWSVVMLFAVAWASEHRQAIHQPAGYLVLALVGLRIIWGFIGPRHARFADFVRSPGGVLAYALALLAGRAPRILGHNPLGGVMVLLLMAMLIATGTSGWLMTTDAFRAIEWIEDLHEALASLTLALVGVHVLSVLAMSLLHGEHLVRAMITGRKRASG